MEQSRLKKIDLGVTFRYTEVSSRFLIRDPLKAS